MTMPTANPASGHNVNPETNTGPVAGTAAQHPSPSPSGAANTPASSFARPSIGLLVFAAGVVATLWATGKDGFLSFASMSPEAMAARQAAEATRKLQKTAGDNSELASASDSLLARQQWKELKRQIGLVTQIVSELQAATMKWNSRQAALRTSEQGKRIAGNKSLLAQFEVLAVKPRPDVDELQNWVEQTQELGDLVTHGLDIETLKIEPKSALKERVQDLLGRANAALRSQRSDDAALGLLLDSLSETDTPDSRSLAQALSEREQVRIQDHLSQNAVELEKVRAAELTKERQKLLALEQKKLEAETALKAAESEQDVLRAQAVANKAGDTTKALIKSIEADRKQQARNRKFDAEFPAMKGLLTPLISPGHMALAKEGWKKVDEAQPISFRALEERGLLKPQGANNTLDFMIQAFGSKSNNDRPQGTFPARLFQLGDDTGLRLQQFLNDYRDILIERKLMLP
ncbi:MAG: hypothetical protein JSS02_34935 [Planctomycetes bacterium]|nr:hypothetical protein [Planctomycetota bacterium]